MDYCWKCGANLKDNSSFCHVCGAKTTKVHREEFSVDTDNLIEKCYSSFKRFFDLFGFKIVFTYSNYC